MPDSLTIQSHKGPYCVAFEADLLRDCRRLLAGQPHFIVDANVARIYRRELEPVVTHPRTLVLEANEENKSIERVIPMINQLVANRVRRGDVLIAVGGGVIQDVTCFIASTLMRGVEWKLVPTTLLAQADSCIGSKSSINVGATKNILGTFNPPREIFVCAAFLDTLEEKDIRSGIGEILKVHAIEGAESFDRLAAAYEALIDDRETLLRYVHSALRIKQVYIEPDEFDRGIRNIFNYGHSFGHAIESATDFAIPHGIAVTIGMDIANRVAVARGLLPERHHRRMHSVLRKNYAAFGRTPIPVERMLSALTRDKKNTATRLVLIMPQGEDARVQRVEIASDEAFAEQCRRALEEVAT